MSFLVNTDVQPKVPQDWADLLDPAYKGQIALSGDPRTSNQAIQAVYASGSGQRWHRWTMPSPASISLPR